MILVQQADFDAGALQARLRAASAGAAGALVTFTGYVRDFAPDEPTETLYLEHYPGMCERVLRELGESARERWGLSAYAIVHRVGALARADQIVFVGAACPHRGNAFRACEFMIDALKTRAPFWKREELASGRQFWVEQKDADRERTAGWQSSE
ncbi:molybdenum cofactor biosynthesis protein MoaE [Verticiella sediminum]|uniref:Molybdopterin synthase catalytic subunit n=1 Tax=Verticiella sediminum TaxID=1247510 RepID=A0A556A881_9BURK|nr:molybdenum cofactor biosynthesis protein MoaE [Verticiella sediminum]TSH89099.1 molybdenum cofactor biosynthesis protein MoaE [Verticiella sediminum]